MKIILLIVTSLIVAVGVIATAACQGKGDGDSKGTGESQKISHYTCPMHPHIHADKPGECPICHMSLVPVYLEEPPSSEESDPSSMGTKPTGPVVTISTARQQSISITTDIVKKIPLTKKIRTVGEVAYDPELATAQREFVEAIQNAPSLKQAAKSRLLLLGMSETEIRELEKKRKLDSSLYLPTSTGSVWVNAPVYEHEVPLIKPGQKATLRLPSTGEGFEGTVRGMEPVLDQATRSSRVRIEVANAGGKIRPGVFLDATIETDLGEEIAVPKSAIIDTGVRQIVFVVHEKTRFESREVKLGTETENHRVVLSGLTEGEVVATNAVFLIDSESQLKAAVSGMKSKPTCPEGQQWDNGMNMCMPK